MQKEMECQKTHKKSIKLTKNPNDGTDALKGGSFCIFQHTLLQNIKKLKWDTLMKKNSKKSQCRKKPFNLPRYGMLRGQRKNFLSSLR